MKKALLHAFCVWKTVPALALSHTPDHPSQMCMSHPWSDQGQFGWSFEQPSVMADVLAQGMESDKIISNQWWPL